MARVVDMFLCTVQGAYLMDYISIYCASKYYCYLL